MNNCSANQTKRKHPAMAGRLRSIFRSKMPKGKKIKSVSYAGARLAQRKSVETFKVKSKTIHISTPGAANFILKCFTLDCVE